MFDTLVLSVSLLDSLPNVVRAMLSAGVFAGLVCFIGTRLAPGGPAVAISFRKTALTALLILPHLVYFAFDWRLVLVVEELPGVITAPVYFWQILVLVWVIGVVGFSAVTLADIVKLYRRFSVLEGVDDKLLQRLGHWQRRLNIDRQIRLGTGATPQVITFGLFMPSVVLPRAVVHWPSAIQDVLLIHALCHIKKRDWLWLMGGKLVSAIYWPVPWVRRFANEFSGACEHTGDTLAASCFRDGIGYLRALRHIEQRLGTIAPGIGAVALQWGDSGPVETRTQYLSLTEIRDPNYDKVFWSIALAAIAMVLLTGTTLEKFEAVEAPELVLAPKWETSFQPSERLFDIRISRKRRQYQRILTVQAAAEVSLEDSGDAVESQE